MPVAPEPQAWTSLPRWIRVADVATVLLGLIASIAALTPIQIDAIHLSIRQWPRVLLIAAIVTVIRHRFVAQPSLRQCLRAWWEAASARWPAGTTALPIALVTRVLVVLVGYAAVVMIGFPPAAAMHADRNVFWELPQRWDASWYLSLAREGYLWNGDIKTQQNLNFFPAYPVLIRIVSWFVQLENVPQGVTDAWTATLLSMLAFAGAMIYLYRLVVRWFDAEIATGAVLLMATYPFALFFSAVYTEALFLLCVVGAWYHLEQRQPALAASWGVVAGLCRPPGGLLSLALLVWVIVHSRKSWPMYLAAIAPLVGTLLYSAWAWHLTGRPFVWAELQRSAWSRTFEGPAESVLGPMQTIVDIGFVRYAGGYPWTMMNLLPALLALVAIWPVTRRLGLAAGVFLAVGVGVPLLNGGLVSMGRYSAVMFPLFVWLALIARGRMVSLLAACFGIGQGLAAALFFTWRPLF
jgi:hypothetical protein